MTAYPLDWEDSGSAESYTQLLHKQVGEYTFAGKVNEFTYRVDGRILKLCESPETAAARFRRAQSMPPDVVPEVPGAAGAISIRIVFR